MNILLLGADGQVGWRLRNSLSALGQVTALTRAGSGPWRGDLTDAAGIEQTVQGLRPGIIVNAAAYTAVDRAESQPELAHAVNARACEVLAAQAERIGAWLVHYSTDVVFDGSGRRPWKEDDPTGPVNVYGASKLAGEGAILQGCQRHLILRTSWVYDSRGRNFLKTILAAALERESLEVVDDQFGAPTAAALVADSTTQVLGDLRDGVQGVYHLAASGATSRHGWARFAVECARRHGMPLRARAESVRPIASQHGPGIAQRPANSRLDTSRLRTTFGLTLPAWQSGVEAAVAEIAAAAAGAPR